MTALSTIISLALIWILFFWLYRDYRLDYFRQRLFTLRGELFDLALEGHISFDDPAYGMLRSTLNGMIRFGHKLGLFDVLVAMWLGRDKAFERSAEQYARNWDNACRSLPPDVQQQVRKIKEDAEMSIVGQVIFTSAFLAFTSLAVIFGIFLYALHQETLAAVQKLLRKSSVASLITSMDSAAFSAAQRM